MNAPRATELRLKKDRRTLHVDFDNGEAADLDAEYLRVMSPSAEVQGHSPEQRQTVGGKRDVEIIKLAPVGNYAVRITFDDLHDTGIFSWAYLHELAHDRDSRWRQYLRELDEKGLNREPRRR